MEINPGSEMQERWWWRKEHREMQLKGTQLNFHHKGSQSSAAKTELTAHSIILSFTFFPNYLSSERSRALCQTYMLSETKPVSAVEGAYISRSEMNVRSHRWV